VLGFYLGGDIMPVFEMISYHNKKYSTDIPLHTEEIAGNFDVRSITPIKQYSLHTEYSYGRREFRNEHLAKYPAIVSANKDGIPMLWYSEKWAEEFACFILEITSDCIPPKYIEFTRHFQTTLKAFPAL